MATIAAGSLIVAGCASSKPTVHGIQNFGEISPGIYRGGEPSAEGNAYLKSIGVTRQIKLNLEPDLPGTDSEFAVVKIPITAWEQIFGFGLKDKIKRASNAMIPGSYVHCEFGKNRTGTVVGYFRITHGWSNPKATAEMKQYGWGDSLPGLKWFWKTQTP